MKKIIVLTYIIVISFFLITGCKTPAEPPLTNQEASLLMSEITTAVTIETSYAYVAAIPSERTTKAETIIDYTNDSETVIITGTLSYDTDDNDGDTDMYPINYTMNITLIDYIPLMSENISLINGSMTYIMLSESIENYSYSYSGDYTTIYKGEEYECSMSFEMTFTGSTYEYSGSYTINDYTYTF